MTWLCDLGSKVLHSNAGDNFLSKPINTFSFMVSLEKRALFHSTQVVHSH